MLNLAILKRVAVVGVGLCIYLMYAYVGNLQSIASQLKEDNAKLFISVAHERANVRNMKNQMEADKVRRDTLQKQLDVATTSLDETRRLLANHDFAKLLKEKPGLISTRMSNATKRLFVDIEAATSSD